MRIRMAHTKTIGWITGIMLAFAAANAGAGDRLLFGTPVRDTALSGPQTVVRRCLTPWGNDQKLGGLSREHPWSLPTEHLADDFDTTIHCLVLRFNFQYEDPDDGNTTGRGLMDLGSEGVLIDPPPHDSLYFDSHLRALSRYWEQVSEGKVHLQWDIYPPYSDSVYQLPHAMSHYGKCSMDSVVSGLEDYFVDCLQLADTAQLLHVDDSARWNIDFSKYQAFFLFHAGSDRQNDIGFPTTCSDMFTGFIRFGGSVEVDGGAASVNTALLMPEALSQDGRVDALNTVLAHEFGHQLGLVDLYDSRTFMSQIGDFGLMDNAGQGTRLDLGESPYTSVGGTIPVYPCAWSRAYLGFVDVQDIRNDTTAAQVVAAGLSGDHGTKVARIPISETEYYLIECRTVELDSATTALRADSITGVIQGPVDSARSDVYTGEYDYLLPGSGMLIYLVDEAVAAMDYSGDGEDNFYDNHLQWWVDSQKRKFLTLVEADGLTGFGGYFRSGYGRAADMFRDDNNSSFTPNTNPPSIDNTGNNTHIYITNITRLDTASTGSPKRDVRFMSFDVEFDRKADGFPVRVGMPLVGLSPIADDLDGDGIAEIIVASGNLLSVFTPDGRDFLRSRHDYDTISCPYYYDSAVTYVNTGTDFNPAARYAVPVFVQTPNVITACPVTGQFPGHGTMVAVGYPTDQSHGRVTTYDTTDANHDARADSAGPSIETVGWPIALAFGDRLDIVTDSGYIYLCDSLGVAGSPFIDTTDSQIYGLGRLGKRLLIVGGRDDSTRFTLLAVGPPASIWRQGRYMFGPVIADLNRDSVPDIVAFTADGDALCLSIDTTAQPPTISVLWERSTGRTVTANPIVGDVDGDGYADIIAPGAGMIAVYEAGLTDKADYPRSIDDRYPDSVVLAAPVLADIQRGGRPEITFTTAAGNVYALGDQLAYGFPLSSGRQVNGITGSTPVLFHDQSGGKLGYVGGDGWFYGWEVDTDTTTAYWPMNGGGPAGHFALPAGVLGEPMPLAERFDDKRYYNYPNPVAGNETTIRYYLGETPRSVTFDIYDLSGVRIAEFPGTTLGMTDNEVVWECSSVAPGVYRCVIEVDFAGGTETAFTDIAIVR